jgi:probable F420-dependent oxidoreductase
LDIQFGALVDERLIARAAELEAMGYDSLWVSEHVLFYVPMLDAVAQLGALAGRTQRVKLGSAIFLLPLRHPTTVAKAFSSLDVLSGGRIVMGIGVGGEYAKEFEACGVPVNERGARANEAMRVIKRLWREDHVTHDGRFFHLNDVTMEPKPVQPGGPPMIVAGRSEAALRRAARLGDGYMPYLFTPERYSDARAKIQAAAAGRDMSGFQWCLHQFIALAETHEAAHRRAVERLSRQYNQDFEPLVERYCVLGTAEECAARLVQFAEAGVRHFILVPLAPAEDVFAHVEAYQTKIVPLVRAAVAGT